ncbi:hypothetical protein MRX96_012551 [Rhipicephalus microplus]
MLGIKEEVQEVRRDDVLIGRPEKRRNHGACGMGPVQDAGKEALPAQAQRHGAIQKLALARAVVYSS